MFKEQAMHPKLAKTLKWCATLLLLGMASAAAAADTSPSPSLMRLPVGETQILVQDEAIRRVVLADPKIADVRLPGVRELEVMAKQPGRTTVRLWLQGRGEPATVVVCVPGKRADGQMQACMETEAAREGSVLGGEFAALPDNAAARAVTGQPAADVSRSAYDTQVQANIKIVEVSRKTLKEMGFLFGKNRGAFTFAFGSPGSMTGLSSGPGTSGYSFESDTGFLPFADAFNLIAGSSNRGLLATLSMLENNGLARTLAEPSLVAQSGQPASFLAGGEFPVPVQGENGSVTIEYKEFGVRLTLTPTVLSPDRIALKVAPEVSELDYSAGVQSGGVRVPALRVRRSDTTVELGDGESFAISGLVSSEMINNVDKIPGLGDIPILGAFFRSTQFQRNDKELVMVVTPQLVRPIARGAPLPALPGQEYEHYNPSTAELLFQEPGRFDPRGYDFAPGDYGYSR
ncbi:type II and III secretion system protein family protein [Thauera propionica]|uniref:type II and III secretion system protein family protein n=1 Tax=Thauera propionica TaxID=2019431 RepID=UPI0023F43509|nr:type II and III secretion system protein family protein [Thauera propionica]MDD3676606.1 type II and III secretion system protein family protein [Thauera propionica]